MSINLRSYSEEELIRLIAVGDKLSGHAFKVIYERYSSNVHAYCLKIVGDSDAAEDLFQETFIKFYKNVKPDQKYTNVIGFLITIARNLCLNYKRNKKNTVDITEMEFLKYDMPDYENKQLLELIDRAIDLLSMDYKEPFVMKEYLGMSHKEIAEQLGLNETLTKTRVFRAKKKIKEILKPYMKELSN